MMSKKSIVMIGGLGNQMFQFALYLAFQAQGKKTLLDISLYKQIKMHFGYELNRCFGIKSDLVTKGFLHIIFLRLILKFKPPTIVFKDSMAYSRLVFKSEAKYLIGYWQSEKYFDDISDIVRSAFIFKDIDKRNFLIGEKMKLENSVSVHLRRGDYVENPLYSNICTQDYYDKAIKLLIDNIEEKENIKFYIFSNDSEYAKEFCSKLEYASQLIDFNTETDSYKDMYLISKCRYNIIANSSFSWWGAWLNDFPEKKVVAPKKWYNTEDFNLYMDVVPSDWIKI
jgi:hypothetical protein